MLEYPINELGGNYERVKLSQEQIGNRIIELRMRGEA
jgi:hypothetical protein